MPYAKGRWVDQNGRSHNWSGDVASYDRNQIKTQIYSQTGAKDVIISSVTTSDSREYDQMRREHVQEEKQSFREQEQRLKSKSNRYSDDDDDDDDEEYSNSASADPTTVLALIAVFGGIWVFVTFMPWVLMTAYGAGATWIGQKITRQTVEEFSNIDNPDDSQTKKALIVLASAILFGGLGFIHGTGWQKDLNKNTTTNQPKVEQIRQQ